MFQVRERSKKWSMQFSAKERKVHIWYLVINEKSSCPSRSIRTRTVLTVSKTMQSKRQKDVLSGEVHKQLKAKSCHWLVKTCTWCKQKSAKFTWFFSLNSNFFCPKKCHETCFGCWTSYVSIYFKQIAHGRNQHQLKKNTLKTLKYPSCWFSTSFFSGWI